MQQSIQLSDAELDMISRLARAENPDANYDRMLNSTCCMPYLTQ